MHMVDQMVVGHRCLLAHPDPKLFGHAFYFYSLSNGTLLRRLTFNHLTHFSNIHLHTFMETSIAFIANRAFLTENGGIYYT